MDIITENYCTGCDNIVHQVFNDEDFYNHKVGLIECPECGMLIRPCNECDDNSRCAYCPWNKAKISDAMTEEEHILWYKENDTKIYKMMKNGDLGEGYKELIEELEI